MKLKETLLEILQSEKRLKVREKQPFSKLFWDAAFNGICFCSSVISFASSGGSTQIFLFTLRIILVAILCVFQVFGTPLQEWLEPPKNTTVPEGRDAVLACRVKNKVLPISSTRSVLIWEKVGRCYWRKNSRLIYLYPGKYDWEGSPAHGDCSLRIKVLKHFLHY